MSSSTPIFLHHARQMMVKAFNQLEDHTREDPKPENRMVFGRTKIVPFFQELAKRINTSKDSVLTLWYECKDSDPSRPEAKNYRVETRLDPVCIYAYGKTYMEQFGAAAETQGSEEPATFLQFLRNAISRRFLMEPLETSPIKHPQISGNEWKLWLTCVPEALLELTADGRLIPNASPFITFSNGRSGSEAAAQALQETGNAEGNLSHPSVQEMKGMLLRHGPAAGTDSLLLYADLGRFLRVSEALGCKARSVYVVDKETFLDHDLAAAKDAALQNYQFRIALYRRFDLIDPVTLPMPSSLTAHEIDERASRYAHLAATLVGDEPIDLAEKPAFLTREFKTRMSKHFQALYLSPDTAKEFEKQADFMAKVGAHFHRLDVTAFRHYLLLCANLKGFWPDYLHIGTSFDQALDEIDESQVPAYRAHFRRYWVPIGGNLQQWKSVYDTNATGFPASMDESSEVNSSKHDHGASRAKHDLTPMLVTCTDQKRILAWLQHFDELAQEDKDQRARYQLARILSDVLSFAHFLQNQDDAGELREILAPLGEEFFDSWEFYTGPGFLGRIRTFAENWYTIFGAGLRLPYYFFPFGFVMQGHDQTEWQRQLAIYARLIAYLNRQVTAHFHAAP